MISFHTFCISKLPNNKQLLRGRKFYVWGRRGYLDIWRFKSWQLWREGGSEEKKLTNSSNSSRDISNWRKTIILTQLDVDKLSCLVSCCYMNGHPNSVVLILYEWAGENLAYCRALLVVFMQGPATCIILKIKEQGRRFYTS